MHAVLENFPCLLFFHNRWDEWVPETRVLALNEENIARQKMLSQAHKPSGASTSTASGSSGKRNSEKFKKRDSTAGTFASHQSGNVIPLLEEKGEWMKLALTDTLKCILVDEWENITKNQLVNILLISLVIFSCF